METHRPQQKIRTAMPEHSLRQAKPSPAEYEQLVALFNAGHYAELENRTCLLLERYPDSGVAWKMLGATLQRLGKNNLPALQKATEFLPDDAEAHYNLGDAFVRLGRLVEAETSYRRVLQIDANVIGAHVNLGMTLYKMGQLDEAETSYRRALRIKPDLTEAHYNLSILFKKQGRLNEAENSYRRVLEIKPDFAEAHNNLGFILKETGRLGEAETSYRRALQIRPDYVDAYYNLGNVLMETGRMGEAEASYRRALQIKPDIAELHYYHGNILREMGRLEEAESCYRRAVQIKPDFAEAHINLGHIHKNLDRLDESLASYRLALKVNGDWKEALHRLTTPLVNHTGLVLDSPHPAGLSQTCEQASTLKEQVKHPAVPVVSLSAGRELHLPAAGHSGVEAGKKLRIILIYPPPWQIPSSGDIQPGMPFGPPKDRGEHNLHGDFLVITYGLLTIAAQAKRAGHDVSVYNLCTCPWRDVVALIAENEADVYGISAFTANRRGMGAVAALIRQQHPQAHIMAGGPFVSALPRDTLLYYRDIDTAVIGEGEETFMELLGCLGSGRPTAGIPGTAWRNGEEVVFGPTRLRIKDLNALAPPFDYFTSNIIMTSRGCPSKCTFCGSFATWGKMLRFHSAESTIDMLKKAFSRLPVPFMAVKDDTFTAHRRRTIAICDAIIENKMNFLWSCDTRVDSLDDELLYKMRLAGCQMISLGVETGSLEILKAIRKETTPEMVLEATRSAQKYGMYVRYYMILCNRGETPETVQQSNDLIKAGRPNRYFFSPLSFFPGTEDWAILREKQGLTPDVFFTNDFKELSVATNRQPEAKDVMLYVVCDVGAVHGFDYTVEEREAVVGRLPYLHSAHVELANAYLRAGRFDEAMAALDRAEELDFPIRGIIYNQRACIAMAQGEAGNALAMLERALQCYSHHIVQKNLKSLRAWADAKVDRRGKPPPLNDSILAMDFSSQLQTNSTHPLAM